MSDRSTDEVITLALSGLCLSGLLLFSVIRLARGDFGIALVDAAGFVGCLWIFWHVVTTRRVFVAGILLSVLALMGTLAVIFISGSAERYLIFPTAMAAYFLLSPRLALLLTTIAVSALTLILMTSMPWFELAKFLLSIIGCLSFTYIFASERNHQRDELLKLSTKDTLTGAGNRRAMDVHLDELVKIHLRNPAPMSMLMLDLDKFKRINDKFGHAAGDTVLQQVVQTISNRLRAGDHLFRYGGDEFVILAPGLDSTSSLGLAEDLRNKIGSLRFDFDSRLRITASFGVAQYGSDQSVAEWLKQSDEALFASKKAGRNKSHAS